MKSPKQRERRRGAVHAHLQHSGTIKNAWMMRPFAEGGGEIRQHRLSEQSLAVTFN